MDLGRTKLRTVIESAPAGAELNAILEQVAALRAKLESSADPGYGYGQPSASSGAAPKPAGAKPKFTKTPKPKA